MLETVAVSADFCGEILPPDVHGWRSSVSGDSVRWAREVCPPGLSYLSGSRSPDKTHRLHAEVNLTALRLGEDQTWQSLSQAEAEATMFLLPQMLQEWVPPSWLRALPDDLSEYRITRLDPSKTVVCESVTDAVESASRALRRMRSGRGVFSLNESHGMTATLRFNKARSWSFYDKTAESRRARRRGR